jgi:hypothetical protein
MPAKLGNFTSALLGKIRSALTMADRRNQRRSVQHADPRNRPQATCGLVVARPVRKLLVEFGNATVQLVPLRPHVLDQHAHSLTESFNLRTHYRELAFELASALRNYDAAFKQYGPQLIDQRRPFPYQSITRPMQGLHVKLLLVVQLNKSHRWSRCRFGNRFCVAIVVLL